MKEKCWACKGTGEVIDYKRTEDGEIPILVTCPICNGTGEAAE